MRNLKRLLLGTTRDIVMIGEDPPILTVACLYTTRWAVHLFPGLSFCLALVSWL